METIKIAYLVFTVFLQIILLCVIIRGISLMLLKKYALIDKTIVVSAIVCSLLFFVGLSGNQLATTSGNVELVVILALTAMAGVALICLLSYLNKKRLGI